MALLGKDWQGCCEDRICYGIVQPSFGVEVMRPVKALI
jgi:hypothetical protein